MKYTKQQRRDIAAAFRHARNEIACGRETFICHVFEFPRLSLPGNNRAWNEVRRRMGVQHGYARRPNGAYVPAKAYALGEWLVDHKVVRHQPKGGTLKIYRLRWLDALIKEFSQ